MRHPKRAITRDLRTRRPKRPGRERAELEALTWPDKDRPGQGLHRGAGRGRPVQAGALGARAVSGPAMLVRDVMTRDPATVALKPIDTMGASQATRDQRDPGEQRRRKSQQDAAAVALKRMLRNP